nr:probable serine protease EDA2 [Tanacetum cinerariifolium]
MSGSSNYITKEPLWFNQTLDHFSPYDHRKFGQRYYEYLDHFRIPDGPIFLVICGESTCGGISDDYITVLAKKFGAAMVTLEHRYYGKSNPFDSLSTENLKFLSSKQALYDLATFRQFYQKSLNLKLNRENVENPWFVFGISYAGALSAWFRLKFPHLTCGSVASSGVVHAILNFEQYDRQIGESVGPECKAILQEVTQIVEKQLDSDGESIKTKFGASELKVDGDFMYLLADGAAEAIQYGNPDKLCTPMIEAKKAGEDVVDAYAKYVASLGFDIKSYTEEYMKNTSSPSRLWWFQVCTEVAFFQVAPANDSIRSSKIDLRYHLDLCKNVFGEGIYPLVNSTNLYYGGTDIAGSKIVFTNGSQDPWRHASKQVSSPDMPAYIVTCHNCGHGTDLRGCPQSPLVPEGNSKNCSDPDAVNKIMPPRMRTRSAGRPAVKSLGGGTGVRAGRGGRGRRPRGVDGVNVNVEGANRGPPDFSTIIAQQLQNLLPAMQAQVGNQGNVGNQNGNVVNENVRENVGNVLVNGNRSHGVDCVLVLWYLESQSSFDFGLHLSLHNAIMEAGSKDRPPMLLLAPDTEVLISEGSPDTRTESQMETYKTVSQDIRDQLNAEAEAVQIILTGIDNDIYSTVDACPNACEIWKAIERLKQGESINSQELKTVSYHKLYDILKQHQNEVNEIRAERIARVANPLALVAQQQPVYHPQNHLTQYAQNSSTKSQQAATRNRGKAIINSPQPIYDQEPSMVAEDDEMSKDKEIDKLMALISLSFKKIYKPTNNNLRTSSNTSRTNQDNSPRIKKSAGYKHQRIGNVVGARETVDLEAHYMYMAKLQEVSLDATDSGPIFDVEPLQKVSNDDHYNVFAIESEHPEQYESVHVTYLIEQDAHNVIIDSLDMSYNIEEIDQNNDDNDLANEQLTRRNSVEYASKVEIDCAKARGDLISYKMESQKSFNKYTQTINDLNQTISEMKEKLYAHQETISILSQKKEAQIKLYKTRKDKELDKVIALENKVK